MRPAPPLDDVLDLVNLGPSRSGVARGLAPVPSSEWACLHLTMCWLSSKAKKSFEDGATSFCSTLGNASSSRPCVRCNLQATFEFENFYSESTDFVINIGAKTPKLALHTIRQIENSNTSFAIRVKDLINDSEVNWGIYTVFMNISR